MYFLPGRFVEKLVRPAGGSRSKTGPFRPSTAVPLVCCNTGLSYQQFLTTYFVIRAQHVELQPRAWYPGSKKKAEIVEPDYLSAAYYAHAPNHSSILVPAPHNQDLINCLQQRLTVHMLVMIRMDKKLITGQSLLWTRGHGENVFLPRLMFSYFMQMSFCYFGVDRIC